MVLTLMLLLPLFALAAGASSPGDPAKTDADKYSVLLEDDRVRVLDYRDRPGEKTTLHHHPDFVLYALTPFRRRLTFTDGKTVTREFKAGDVISVKAQDHVGENIGDTPTHAIIVEMKHVPARPSPRH